MKFDTNNLNNEHRLSILNLRSKFAYNLKLQNSLFVDRYSTFKKFIETKVTAMKPDCRQASLQGFNL